MGAGVERMKMYEDGKGSILEYEKGWARMMGDYWRERMEKLRTIDTGTLYKNISARVEEGAVTVIEHKFMQYGIYVAAGVGKGYLHDNGGDLPFLAKDADKRTSQVGAGLSSHAMLSPRFKHTIVRKGKNKGKLAAISDGNHRKKSDWFARKYYYSVHRLNEREAEFYGAAYQGLISTALDEIFNNKGLSRNL